MIERALYAAATLALLAVIVFEPEFVTNVTHAIGHPIEPFNSWKVAVSGLFAVLVTVALVREWKR